MRIVSGRKYLAGLAFLVMLSTLKFLVYPTMAQTPTEESQSQAQQMLKVLNHGDATAIREFSLAHFSKRFRAETSLDEVMALFQKARAESGGLEVAAVLKPEMEGETNLLLRTLEGNHFVRMVEFEKEGKISDFFFLTATDPKGDITANWPKEKLSRDRIRSEIERHANFTAARDLFSGVVLVAEGNTILFSKAYGMGEKSFQSPNRLDTKFNLASMDKMFVGVAIGQLVAAGKLSFDDKLASVLPDYPNQSVAEKITIRQLLTHTSGLGDALKPEMREKKKQFKNVCDYFPLFVNDPLRFEPGSKWGYSNAGYIVLGAVIEKASGQSYFDYVRDHIFIPTGMKNTGYFELDEVTPNLAIGYGRFEDDVLGIGPLRNNGVFLGYKGNSAGGGYSTATDLLAFAQALRNHVLLSKEMTETITSGKVRAADGQYGYGFWQWQHYNHKDVRGNAGGGPNSGIDSEMDMFWDRPYTVILLSNYDPPGGTNLIRGITEFLSYQ